MTAITIRAAQLSDAEALKHLLDRSWRTHWAPHVDAGAVARYQAEQPVLGYVDSFISQLTVAERGGVVVGMYHLDGAWLHAIHVDSWAIGTGVGRALMDAAEAAGARQLDVRAFNVRARDFYAARGWVEIDEHDDSEMGMLVRTLVMERL
ncbi:MAG: GNAT family N-acetyltransferase [Alphaproteobacteria bacterium]|jgi:ribosomal protein S18 acetylase RimI-like enzyme|nr:GNAT family N-acetyltransferase [Alphaproteobacteria bacterium]